jgi:hypothetical protein
MLKFKDRARGTVTAAALAAAGLFLGACNVNHELLAPQQPGVISPEAINSATAADALWVGALNRWNNAFNGGGNNTGSLWGFSALFTDELRSSDTFSQRNDADQRNLANNDGVLTSMYRTAQQARGRARDAINALLTYDQSATGRTHVGEMYLAMGYIEMEMSEMFCNGLPFGETVDGVPQYTQPLTNAQGFTLAVARFDTALTFLTGADASTSNIKNAVRVAKARAQVDLADFSGAAATVASVPTTFQYNWTYSQPTFDNDWWVMGPSVGRYNAGDSTDLAGRILNAIPFARLADPRVVVVNKGFGAGEDGHSEFFEVQNWDRDDPIPPLSGIDARLIQGEAALQAGDIPGVMTVLNNLRDTAQTIGVFPVPVMTALATPATLAAATDLFFREKALWQFERGYRIGDLRRLVRQYNRGAENVFPSGPGFVRNGTPAGAFGTEVAFPVPDDEKTNPNFHGCLDSNA